LVTPMGSKPIDSAEVPAYGIVVSRLKLQWPTVSISETGSDFDTDIYSFRLLGPAGTSEDVHLGVNLLNDLKDNPASAEGSYTRHLVGDLDLQIRDAVISSRVVPLNEEVLRFLLLQCAVASTKGGNAVNKWNAIGRGIQGDFERWLKTDLSAAEKASLNWAWDDLVRCRFLVATGLDLVAPEDWVVPTQTGVSAIENKSFVEYQQAEREAAEQLGLFLAGHQRAQKKGEAERTVDLDPILGIPTRKEYELRLPALLKTANGSSPLSMLMLDLDNFKAFNDSYGHDVGDKVLASAASTVRTIVAGKGEAFRYGGEEIVVLLPNHSIDEGVLVASRIRQGIEGTSVDNLDAKVTASLGVATYPAPAHDAQQLFKQADVALYDSKHSGKNRVTVNRDGRVR